MPDYMTDYMTKAVAPGAFNFDGPIMELVKMSSRGLRGNDLSAFIKRAGYPFLGYMADASPGEVLVHMLAVSATEFTGPNRNGDGFDEEPTKLAHPTFVSHARPYRDHDNKPHSKSYGRVIKSAHNERMHRFELLIGYNETKEAADRNKGHIATRELQKLASGRDSCVSMACRLPYDVCSGCGNKAKSRQVYCDAGQCKYGGLKHNLMKVAADGHILHAKNPNCTFFDISDLEGDGAERIAFTLGRLDKVASHGPVLSGAYLAELFDMDSEHATTYSPFLNSLVAVEMSKGASLAFYDGALSPPRDTLDFPDVMPGTLLRALAIEKVALSVKDWLVFVGGKEAAIAEGAVYAALPGVFERLQTSESADCSSYRGDKNYPNTMSREFAQKCAKSRSLDPKHLDDRIMRSAITQESPREKRAAVVTKAADTLAREYARYQLAFLEDAYSDDISGKMHAGVLLVRANAIN